MARSTKLTPALHTAIIQAVSVGVPFARAAVMAGIDETTARQWRQRGEGRHRTRGMTPVYVAFVADLKKAEAQDEARRIARINQAGQGGAVVYEKTTTHPDGRVVTEVRRARPEWQADAWHLERSHPDTWARPLQKVAPTTPDGTQPWEPGAVPAAPSPTFFADLVTLFQTLGPVHANGHDLASSSPPDA